MSIIDIFSRGKPTNFLTPIGDLGAIYVKALFNEREVPILEAKDNKDQVFIAGYRFEKKQILKILKDALEVLATQLKFYNNFSKTIFMWNLKNEEKKNPKSGLAEPIRIDILIEADEKLLNFIKPAQRVLGALEQLKIP